MRKGKHIQTDFIKFMLEKYSNPKIEDETQDEIELQKEDDFEFDENRLRKLKKNSEGDEGPEEPIEEKEEDKIDDLINEYKKVKKLYENSRIQNKRK